MMRRRGNPLSRKTSRAFFALFNALASMSSSSSITNSRNASLSGSAINDFLGPVSLGGGGGGT